MKITTNLELYTYNLYPILNIKKKKIPKLEATGRRGRGEETDKIDDPLAIQI